MIKSTLVLIGLSIVSVMANLKMPDEGGAHKLTWMAYGATKRAWGTSGPFGANRLVARKDLMRIAANIARFEPVMIAVDNGDDQAEAQNFLEQVIAEPVSTDDYNGPLFTDQQLPDVQRDNIKFLVQPVDDLWMRDTGAVFVKDPKNALYGVNFNFNGWGQVNSGAPGWQKDPNKAANGIQDQPVSNDQRIANFTIAQSNATLVSTWLVLEGGGVEVDGNGTAICTESSILNDNRNPGKSKADVEQELGRTLGVTKVIWLPGKKAEDITDGHVDFAARFAGNARVFYTLDIDPYSPDYQPTRVNQQILANATDVSGSTLTPIALKTPNFDMVRSAVNKRNGWSSFSRNFMSNSFAASYIGYYTSEKFVLMTQYGDLDADYAAFTLLKNTFPTKTIMQITVDGISNGGGTIHCSTQQLIA